MNKGKWRSVNIPYMERLGFGALSLNKKPKQKPQWLQSRFFLGWKATFNVKRELEKYTKQIDEFAERMTFSWLKCLYRRVFVFCVAHQCEMLKTRPATPT